MLASLIVQQNKTYFDFILISGDILNGVTGPIPAAAEPAAEAVEPETPV